MKRLGREVAKRKLGIKFCVKLPPSSWKWFVHLPQILMIRVETWPFRGGDDDSCLMVFACLHVLANLAL